MLDEKNDKFGVGVDLPISGFTDSMGTAGATVGNEWEDAAKTMMGENTYHRVYFRAAGISSYQIQIGGTFIQTKNNPSDFLAKINKFIKIDDPKSLQTVLDTVDKTEAYLKAWKDKVETAQKISPEEFTLGVQVVHLNAQQMLRSKTDAVSRTGTYILSNVFDVKDPKKTLGGDNEKAFATIQPSYATLNKVALNCWSDLQKAKSKALESGSTPTINAISVGMAAWNLTVPLLFPVK